ncbi:hypothetical protein [Phenylobacterium sp.]|uniref:hypothetical protein n=1 Tax=Phenylobacterium sp. TaxID=1871053 RepID=UPI0035680086
MIWLRIVLAILLLLQAASTGFPLMGFAAYRLGVIHPTAGPAVLMISLWSATPDWQLVVWLAAVLLLPVAALRLVLRRPALWFYVAGIGLNMGLTQLMHLSGAYRRVFGTAALRFNYDRLAVLVLVGLLIWWVEQRPVKAISPPASP